MSGRKRNGAFQRADGLVRAALRFQKMNEWIDDEKNVSVRGRMPLLIYERSRSSRSPNCVLEGVSKGVIVYS